MAEGAQVAAAGIDENTYLRIHGGRMQRCVVSSGEAGVERAGGVESGRRSSALEGTVSSRAQQTTVTATAAFRGARVGGSLAGC